MSFLNGFTYNELFLLAVKRPIMAQLEITRNCNQSCFFCFRSCNPKARFNDLSLDKWQGVVKKIVALGVRELNFSGGEIFLFSGVDRLFSYAKKAGIKRIIVNTNGFADLKKFDLSAVDQLVFSVHGLKKVHEETVDLKGSFGRLVDSMDYALSKKIAVGINTVVTPQNINSLRKIYDYFSDKKLVFHAFNLQIDRQGLAGSKKTYGAFLKDYIKFLKTIPRNRRKLRHGLQNIAINDLNYFSAAVPLPHCAAGKYKLVVDYKGDIYPCRYFQSKEYKCGNIFKDVLVKVWEKGKGFNFFRKFVLKGKMPVSCKGCLKRSKCLGGCLAWRIYNPKFKEYGKDIRCEFGDAYLGS